MQGLGPGRGVARQQRCRDEKIAYILTPISGAPDQVVKDMKARLNGTLGTHVQAKPEGGPPSFSEQHVRDIACEAIQPVVDTRQQNNAGGDFQDGVLTAMRTMKEKKSDPQHKPFSNATEGKLMGLCMVAKWCNMPQLWTEIEGCKSDRDLRTILQTHWGKYKKDLNTMFYDIYWRGADESHTNGGLYKIQCSYLFDIRAGTEPDAADAEDRR